MAGYGMRSHLMIDFQNSGYTSKTNSLQAIAITDESLELQIEQIQEESLYGRFASSPTQEGGRQIQGDINIEAEPQAIGYFFRAFCGSDDVTAHTHTFKMNTTDFDEMFASVPFTAEVYRDVGSAFLYYDLVANTLEVNIANGELLTCGLGVIGAGYSKKAAGSPTFPTGQTPFKWDQVSASLNGAAVFDITDLSISGNKNLEALWTLQETSSPKKIKRTSFEEIEVSGTLLFQSHSYYQAFEDQTENQLVVNFQSNSPNSLTFDFPALKFISMTPQVNGQGYIEAAFNARAEYSTNSATAMEINLTNVRTVSY